jgi:hypothetical protein
MWKSEFGSSRAMNHWVPACFEEVSNLGVKIQKPSSLAHLLSTGESWPEQDSGEFVSFLFIP